VGDLNGDGYTDLIIGAEGASPNSDYSGSSYVVFGKSTFNSALDLSSLDGTNGFRLDGVTEYDYSGRTLSGVGDLNGDGYADLIIGADTSQNGLYSGSSYVIFGKSSFSSALDLSSLDGTNGFRLDGITQYDKSGSAVSGGGDVNGDGYADLIVGAYGTLNGDYTGSSVVIFGDNWTNSITQEGTDGADELTGSAAADAINGGRGDDKLDGQDGDDRLLGGQGADTLIGGAGNDWLTGGLNADVFSFRDGSGNDTITDFQDDPLTNDLINLYYHTTATQFSDLTITQDGDDAIITLPDGSTITLADFDSTRLTAEDFNFVMQLALFQANPQQEAILIEWQTESELSNLGFNLYRASDINGERLQLNNDLIPSPGSEEEGGSYQFVDESVEEGETYYYWLQNVDTIGQTSLHGPVSATANIPTALTFQQLESQNAPPTFVAWFLGLLAALGFVVRKRVRNK
jgi:Ca2+-binding RTX toxin-like protein